MTQFSAPTSAMALVAVLGLIGCGAASTPQPATRYENRAWSVDIPDDLTLRPVYKDPGMLWAVNQVQFIGPDSAKTSLSINAAPQACTVTAANQAAQAMLTALRPGGSPTADTRPIGSNDVAIGTVTSASGQSIVAAVICGQERVVLSTALGLSEADVERILRSFALREPVSDALNPPSAEGSPAP